MKTQPRRRFLTRLSALAALTTLALTLPMSVGAVSPATTEPARPKPEQPGPESAALPDPSSPTFALDALRTLDDMYRGKSSHGLMEMTVKTKHFTRTLAMETWSLGEDHSLVRIVAPKKEKGTATLMSNDDLFTYLSKTGRTIKITGGMMGGSWMGSHFTNDDLVAGSRLSDDFDISRASKLENDKTYVFRLIPKPDAAVVWGKVEVTLRRSDLQPISQLFFDEDLEAVRRMTYADHKVLAGNLMPTRIRMEPLDEPGEYTEMRHKRLELDVDIEPSFFTLQKLRSL